MAQETQPSSPQPKSCRGLAWFLVLLPAVLLAGLLWGGYQLQLQTQRLSQISGRLAVVAAQAQASQAQITLMRTAAGQDTLAWRLAEIEHVLRLADDRLRFEQNTQTAEQLLQLADRRLQALALPVLVPIRADLAQVITQLQHSPEVDVTGTLLRLQALSAQSTVLPLVPTVHAPAVQQAAKTKPAADKAITLNSLRQLAGWQQLGAQVWHVLQGSWQQAVLIRHREAAVAPLISPEQQGYWVAQVQMALAQAGWAVLHRDTAVYQHTLQQVVSWVKQYYVASDKRVDRFVKHLTALATLDLRPARPDLSAVLVRYQARCRQLATLRQQARQAQPRVSA